MADEKAVVPVEQKTVAFYEDEVTAVRLTSGEVYVPIRPIIRCKIISSLTPLTVPKNRTNRNEGDRNRDCGFASITVPPQ